MAITIATQPATGIYLSGGEHVYVATTNVSGQKQHTITAKIYVNGTQRGNAIKLPVNAANAAIFDLSKVFDSHLLVPEVHLGADAQVRTTTTVGQATFQVRFNEDYLVGNNLSVDVNTSDVNSNTIRLVKGGVDFYDNDTRLANAITGKAMLGLNNDDDEVTVDVAGRFFTTVVGTGWKIVLNAGSDVDFYTYTSSTPGLCQVDVGPTRAFASSYLNGVKSSYTVKLVDTANSDALVSSFVINTRQDYTKDQDTELVWWAAGWKSFNFTRNHTTDINTSVETYVHSHIDYNAATYSKVSGRLYNAGESVSQIEHKRSTTVNSRWLDEPTQQYVDTILSAKKVWLREGNLFIPILIEPGTFRAFENNADSELQNRRLTYRRSVNQQLK